MAAYKPASDRQINFLASLVEKHDWQADRRPEFRAAVQRHIDNGFAGMSGGYHGTASKMITYLKTCPLRKAEPVTAPPVDDFDWNEPDSDQGIDSYQESLDALRAELANPRPLIRTQDGWSKGIPATVAPKRDEPAAEGIYLFNGEVVRVKTSKRSGFRSASVIGSMTRGYHKSRYVKGLVYKLSESDRMSADDAKAYGDKFGQCCNCGKLLTDPESVRLGIGPVCRKHFAFA